MFVGIPFILEPELIKKHKYSPTHYPLDNSKRNEDLLARIRSLAKLIRLCKETSSRAQALTALALPGIQSKPTYCQDPLWEPPQFFKLDTKSGN